MISRTIFLACLLAIFNHANCQLYQLAPGSCGFPAPASIPAPCPRLPLVYPNYGPAPPPCGCGLPILSAPALPALPSFASLPPSCSCGIPLPSPCGCQSPAPCGCGLPTNLPFLSAPALTALPSFASLPPSCSCGIPLPSPCGCQSPAPGLLTEVIIPNLASLSLLNPLLPAASPVSALANPVAPSLPAAIPNGCYNKCTYGKRCPIPPPFI